MSNLSEKSEPEDTEPLLLGNGNIFRGASRDLTREEAQGGNNVLGPGDVVLDRALWGECLDMAGIAGPTALGNLLEYLPVCTAMAIVGRLPGEEGKMGLDAISLGRAYFNITAIAPVFGIVGALRTLCPQAVGAGKPQLLGVYAQQAMALILAASLPSIVLQFLAADILTAMGESREIATLAQQYSIRMIPQIFGVGGMVTLQRVYQAHKMVWSNLAICAAGFAVAPPLQALLVNTAGLGFLGAGNLYTASYLVLQVLHLARLGMGDSIFRPRIAEALHPKQMRSFVGLSLPAFLQVLLKWTATETVVFVSGVLRPPDRPLATSSMATNVTVMMLMAWIGILVAVSVKVGWLVGAGDVEGAKTAGLAGAAAAAVMGCAAAVVIFLARDYIIAFFTVDEGLQQMGAALLQIVAALVLLDALNNAVGGVLSGLGMQRAIAASQLAGYYAIGIPAGVALAMMAHGGSEDGVYGLWIGTTMAMGASLALQCTVLARHSWDRSLDEAQKRLQDGQLEVSPAPGTCKIPGGSGSGSSRGELVCPSLGEGGCAEMIVLQEGLNNPIGTRHLAISCQRRKSLGGTS